MTGCMLMADDFCLVIAEGSQKSHKKYSRLMINRIDWNQSQEEEQQGQSPSAVLTMMCRFRALSQQDSCVVNVRCSLSMLALNANTRRERLNVSALHARLWLLVVSCICAFTHPVAQSLTHPPTFHQPTHHAVMHPFIPFVRLEGFQGKHRNNMIFLMHKCTASLTLP